MNGLRRNEDAQGTGNWYQNNLSRYPNFIGISTFHHCNYLFNYFFPYDIQHTHLWFT